MSIRPMGPLGESALCVLVLLTGCTTREYLGREGTRATKTVHHAPSHYAQAMDSATNGCLRNPACYTAMPGEEAVIPWMSRTVSTATTVMKLLSDVELKLIEHVLTQCAQAANKKVHEADDELKGQEPNREQCKKVVHREGNKEITRAMELGTKKHKLAIDCARIELAERFSENASVEPTYQKAPRTGQWRWLDPKQVEEWLRIGLSSELWGSLVPDVVIHASSNPNKVQRVYDFKFPCPATNRPSWGQYAPGQPHHPKTQGQIYKEALGLGDDGLFFVTSSGIR